jgi:BirA family biotin operon repressor/biotin-[acetyl-CoA-carboxylase] ligase
MPANQNITTDHGPRTTDHFRGSFIAHAEHHATVTSTNDRAAAAAREGQPLPLVVVADEQTAGRGRGGNSWWTGRGSLAMSLALDPAAHALPRQHVPRLALAAGVAVVETLRPLVPGASLGLHWPNDVYAEGRKLAGILVECPALEFAIVGVGVNTNNSLEGAPAEVRRRATTLWELTARRHEHMALIADFVRRFAAAMEGLAADASSFGRQFDALCLQHGQRLAVRCGSVTLRGRCQGIAADGALLLATADGPRRVYSGALVKDESAK